MVLKNYLDGFRNINRYQRIVVGIWISLLVATLCRAWIWPHVHSVYPVFSAAGHRWLLGQDLYRQIPDGLSGPFRYSPLAACLFAFFSILPERLGDIFWRMLNAGVYLGSLAWWAKSVLPFRLTRNAFAAYFFLVLPLSLGSLNNAQSNPLVVGLILAGLASVKAQWWMLGALLLAMACFFKLYVVVVGLLLAALFAKKFAFRFSLALTLGFILPFLLQEPSYVWNQYFDWIHFLRVDDRSSFPLDIAYRDLRLIYRQWLTPLSPESFRMMGCVVGVGVAVLCAAGKWKGWSQRRLLTILYSLSVCWITLLGPATESATYIFAAPVMAWALLEAFLAPGFGHRHFILILSSILFLVADGVSLFPGGSYFHRYGLHPFAALLLFIWLLGMTLHFAVVNDSENDVQ